MRKITFLLSLCAALFAGTTQTSAQITTVGVRVSSVDDIRDGYKYAIRNVATAATARRGYVYENAEGALCINNSDGINANLTALENSEQYIFTAHKTDNGFTLKTNLGKFVGSAGSGSVPTADEGATITFTPKPNSASYVWNIQSDGKYWNVDPGTLVIWNDQNDANGKFEIIPVNAEDFESYTSIEYTFDNNTTATVEESGNLLPNQNATGIFVPAYISMSSASFNNGVLNVQANITTPFKASDSYENATWNFLTLGGNLYLRDTNGADRMTISGNTSTGINTADADSWAFVGNPISGFKIYNKQAGSTKILSSSTTMTGDNGSTTYPILVDEATLPEGNNTYWDATSSSNQTNGFFLGQHGYADNRMNNRNGNLAYWTGGADNGSTFVATSIDDLIVNTIKGIYAAPTGSVGTFVDREQYAEEANVVLESKSITDYYALIEKIGTEKVPFETGKYYRLFNAYKSQYLANVDNKQYCPLTANETEDEARLDASTIVSFEGDETNGYKIKSEGLYVSQAGKVQATQGKGIGLTATEADIDRFKLVPQDNRSSLLALQSQTTTGNNSYLHCSGVKGDLNTGQGGGIVLWTATAEASRWYIVPATDLDITLNDAGENSYATLYLPFAVEVADGVTAYTGQESADGSSINVTAIESGAVPANNGVLLVGAAGAGTVSLNIAADEAATLADNVFTGTNVATTISDANSCYIFGNGDNGVGFYHPAGTTLKANRAYIANTTGAAAASLKLVFGNNGETTGIEGIESAAGNADAPVYDLSGRRVAKAVKGIYIQNGKKIFVK